MNVGHQRERGSHHPPCTQHLVSRVRIFQDTTFDCLSKPWNFLEVFIIRLKIIIFNKVYFELLFLEICTIQFRINLEGFGHKIFLSLKSDALAFKFLKRNIIAQEVHGNLTTPFFKQFGQTLSMVSNFLKKL